MSDPSAVEVLHGSTRHGEPSTHPERLVQFRPLDPSNRPSPFKVYPDREPTLLPRELARSSLAATQVLSGSAGSGRRLDDELLGTLLFLAAGVTRRSGGGDHEVWFRTAMSAGNLHPVEIYLVRAGLHHYDPVHHGLVELRSAGEVPGPAGAATLVLTGIPFRTCWKYGERGWRHLYWDAGSVVANLLAAADAHGIAAEVEVGFDDEAVAQLVGVDGAEEMPLAVVRLGDPELALPPAGSLAPLTTPWLPVAPRVLRFPLVEEAQAEGTLREAEVDGWRRKGLVESRAAPEAIGEPAGAEQALRVEDVILRRGSTRVFRAERAPAELLEWALRAAARPAHLDVAGAGTLIEHLVNVHDVESAEAGGYRYTGGDGFEGRVRIADPRAAGAALSLGQPLGGDSAFTVFHAVDLDALLATLGPRGYRAAQLEAGVASERLALDAFALGCGATGLTFYDGLVSRYFRTDAAPLLATAVGLPETRPAPSGVPGRPVELRGYGNVMARLATRLRR